MASDNTLEDFWEDLRHKRPALGVALQRTVIDAARAKALRDFFGQSSLSEEVPEWLSFDINGILDNFIQHLEDEYRSLGPAGLIELVLTNTRLSTVNLLDFIRALPADLVKQICEQGAVATSAKGIHALMSFELHYRQNPERFRREYKLTRGGDGVLEIHVQPSNQDPITFRLDNTFDMSEAVKTPAQGA